MSWLICLRFSMQWCLVLESRCHNFFVLESRCCGFLVLESRCCGFLVLESRCRVFSSSEKTRWNHDVVAYLSPFFDVVVFSPRISMSQFFCLGISMSWFFGLGISMSWFFGLGIPMSGYMCLHGIIFVVIKKTKKSRIIMPIMLLKNISIVQIYAISICIMYA